MSKRERNALIAEVALAIRVQHNAVDAVDYAAIQYLGINRTDLRCLDITERKGRVTAGALAVEMGLTTGAITNVLDRLEEIGYLRRVRDPADRRRVLVEITDRARRDATKIYGPIAESGWQLLSRYSDDELRLLLDFLRTDREMLLAQAERIRKMKRARKRERER